MIKCSFHRCIKKVVAILQEDFSSFWLKVIALLSVHHIYYVIPSLFLSSQLRCLSERIAALQGKRQDQVDSF